MEALGPKKLVILLQKKISYSSSFQIILKYLELILTEDTPPVGPVIIGQAVPNVLLYAKKQEVYILYKLHNSMICII